MRHKLLSLDLDPQPTKKTQTSSSLFSSSSLSSYQASSFTGRTPQLPARENGNATTSAPFHTPAVGRRKREREVERG